MSRAAPVDREDELTLFDQMIVGQTSERILLVRAASGMGKSILLEKFIERRPSDAHFAYVNFKESSLGLADLLSELCDTLGWDRFPTLAALVLPKGQPSVHVSGNTLLGSNQISVFLNAANEADYERQRAALTDAFFNDVDALEKIVLMFDTLNACEKSARAWLAGVFLPRASRRQHLTVIIAGQEVPQPEGALKPKCIVCELESIAPSHWHTYAQDLGLDCTLEWVEGFCRALKGHSLNIASMLESEAQQRTAR